MVADGIQPYLSLWKGHDLHNRSCAIHFDAVCRMSERQLYDHIDQNKANYYNSRPTSKRLLMCLPNLKPIPSILNPGYL